MNLKLKQNHRFLVFTSLSCWSLLGFTLFLAWFIILPSQSFAQSYAPSRSTNNQYTESAQTQCGQDRQCRLERLKILNQKRQQSRAQVTDQRVLNDQEQIDQKYLRKTPRELKSLAFDFESMVGGSFQASGLGASWQWQKHLRLMGSYLFNCNMRNYNSFDFEYNFQGRCFKGGVRYIFSIKNFSSYAEVYGMQMVVDGNIVLYDYGNPNFVSNLEALFGIEADPQTSTNYLDGELESHILGLGVGFDWQAKNGFHLKVGVSTHYILFASLRSKETRANLTDSGMETLIVDDALSLIFDFSLGYAF